VTFRSDVPQGPGKEPPRLHLNQVTGPRSDNRAAAQPPAESPFLPRRSHGPDGQRPTPSGVDERSAHSRVRVLEVRSSPGSRPKSTLSHRPTLNTVWERNKPSRTKPHRSATRREAALSAQAAARPASPMPCQRGAGPPTLPPHDHACPCQPSNPPPPAPRPGRRYRSTHRPAKHPHWSEGPRPTAVPRRGSEPVPA
jgi:hypothetical protein